MAKGMMTVRTHVVIRRELVKSVDELVGRRSRSKFFAEAVEEKLARIRLTKLARKAVGSLANVETPGWETSESAAEWVSSSRTADENRARRPQENP